MIKGSIQEEDITIVNIYAPNIGGPQYIRQIVTAIKGEINSNTIIVGNFNTPLSPMDRSSKMKINKETQALHDTLLNLFIVFCQINYTFVKMYNKFISCKLLLIISYKNNINKI